MVTNWTKTASQRLVILVGILPLLPPPTCPSYLQYQFEPTSYQGWLISEFPLRQPQSCSPPHCCDHQYLIRRYFQIPDHLLCRLSSNIPHCATHLFLVTLLPLYLVFTSEFISPSCTLLTSSISPPLCLSALLPHTFGSILRSVCAINQRLVLSCIVIVAVAIVSSSGWQ